jgi:ABC-type nitrate/sulfonate/bicarbonate transport system substrate-binding protein
VNNGIVAQRAYVAAHRDVIQNYIDALVEGIALMKKDKAFSVGVLKKYLKLDDDQALSLTYDYGTKNLFPSVPTIKPEHLADSIQVLSERNPKARDYDVTKMLDPSFVKCAEDRGLARS